jgi:hypothetical protein
VQRKANPLAPKAGKKIGGAPFSSEKGCVDQEKCCRELIKIPGRLNFGQEKMDSPEKHGGCKLQKLDK